MKDIGLEFSTSFSVGEGNGVSTSDIFSVV